MTDITILSAVYASRFKGLDVTMKVHALVDTGNDDFVVCNQIFSDPDPGQKKYFFVWYTSRDVNYSQPVGLACSEGEQIDLLPSQPVSQGYFATRAQPQLQAAGPLGVTIKRAVYGTTLNGLDVTATCQSIANQGMGTIHIPITNTMFGRDPHPGTRKSFAVWFTDSWGDHFRGYPEDAVFYCP